MTGLSCISLLIFLLIKLPKFLLSFWYMRHCKCKKISLRWQLTFSEMKIINDFNKYDKDSFHLLIDHNRKDILHSDNHYFDVYDGDGNFVAYEMRIRILTDEELISVKNLVRKYHLLTDYGIVRYGLEEKELFGCAKITPEFKRIFK